MDTVKVCVRLRPLTAQERRGQTKCCLRIASSVDGLSSHHEDETKGPQQLVVGKDRGFTFDTVFGITSSQHNVYHSCVIPLVQGFLDGYNATVLAYGQTGTGKTHTIYGSGYDINGTENVELQGIIPRVVTAIFEEANKRHQECQYDLRVEFVEIYNEELRDLLHPETSSKQLSIRENAAGTIVIAGVKSESTRTKQDVIRQLTLGTSSRTTGSTLMNEQSSRSHAIFTIILKQRDRSSGLCRVSKFHLVDLAGSERAKRTGAVAGRFKESVSINQGLLALGNVISALGDEKRHATVHVPYRDSKLTRLLQDSLGGNAKTLMIACVSPASINFEETLNTLKYANRAKNIHNQPIVNQHAIDESKQAIDDEVSRMRQEIVDLHSQLEKSNQLRMGSSPKKDEMNSQMETMEDGEKLKQQLHRCVEAIQLMKGHSVDVVMSLMALERDVMTLGRPVQQRLSEIVKRVNASIQCANAIEVDSEAENDENACPSALNVKRLSDELLEARKNLEHDEEIFQLKNAEIKSLQEKVDKTEASRSELMQRVAELEKGGQLWSNVGINTSASTSGIGNKVSVAMERSKISSARGATAPVKMSTPSAEKTKTSSRHLFTSPGPLTSPNDDDDVLTGSEGDSAFAIDVHHSHEALAVRDNHSEMVQKVEDANVKLRAKIEELQHLNTELSRAREQDTRRWEHERKELEHRLEDAERTSKERSFVSTPRRPHEDEDIMKMYEAAVDRLIEYENCQKQVKSVLVEKEGICQSLDEAAKRVNALEMQKMRQSLTLQKTISEVATSLQEIDDKINQESSSGEAERLKKLKLRAEKKMQKLRQQVEKEELLDPDKQQELDDLEELIQDLTSHINFQESQLASTDGKLPESEENVSPIDELSKEISGKVCYNADASRVMTLVKRCLADVAVLSMKNKEWEQRYEESEESVFEKDTTLKQLEMAMQAARKEFDRRLELEHRDHALMTAHLKEEVKELTSQNKKLVASGKEKEKSSTNIDEMQKLIVSNQKKDSYMAEMEKHIVFYKAKAQQAQDQLQKLLAKSGNQVGDDANTIMVQRLQQLEEANESLMKDLAAAKVYLRSSMKLKSSKDAPAPTIRISKSDLKELAVPQQEKMIQGTEELNQST